MLILKNTKVNEKQFFVTCTVIDQLSIDRMFSKQDLQFIIQP